MFSAIRLAKDYNPLQSDINLIKGCYAANLIKLSVSRTRLVTFTRKTEFLYHVYKIRHSCLTGTHTIRDLGSW